MIELQLGRDFAEIAVAADRIDAFCDGHALPPKIAFDINLSIDELVTNTISYGFGGSDAAEPLIRITIELNDDWVEVRIVDNGAPYDPFSQAPPPPMDGEIEDRRIGGFGVHFVKTLMDDVAYRRDGGWNVVSLRRRRGT